MVVTSVPYQSNFLAWNAKLNVMYFAVYDESINIQGYGQWKCIFQGFMSHVLEISIIFPYFLALESIKNITLQNIIL